MRASPFNGALQPVIAPKELRTDNKAGRAENSNGLRVIGCASKLRLCFSRSSRSAQTRRLSHSFENRRKHRKVRDTRSSAKFARNIYRTNSGIQGSAENRQ